MIITGTELICLVPVSDTYFVQSIWLDKIYGDGEYLGKTIGIETFDSSFYNSARLHSYKFLTSDHEYFSTLKTWEASNTPLNVYIFTVDGVVFWRENAMIRTEEKKINAPRKTATLEVSFQLQKATKLIYNRKNLVDSDLANCNLTTDWTVTGGTKSIINPGHASFTLKNGNVIKIIESSAGSTATILSVLKIPVKVGMKFYFKSNGYGYGSFLNFDFGLSVRNGSGTETELSVYSSGVGGNMSISGNITVSDSTSKYLSVIAKAVGDSTIATLELDNIIVSYKNQENFIDG